MFTQLKNKNVLVVGGSRGIGRGAVEAFVGKGANVFYASRNKAEDLNAEFIQTDASEEQDVLKLFDCLDKIGGVDIVVNLVAINYCRPIEEISSDEWDEVLQTNLKSYFLVCREAVKRMKKKRSGKIINVSSIAGQSRSLVSGVHYVASKAGILGLTRQLAMEVAEYNIQVNALCPSQTMTEMLKDNMTEAEIRDLESTIPLKRISTIEDQVGSILFLASTASDYMTGNVLGVNGGQL